MTKYYNCLKWFGFKGEEKYLPPTPPPFFLPSEVPTHISFKNHLSKVGEFNLDGLNETIIKVFLR